MNDLLVTLCLLLGGGFSMLATVGVWRLPDAFSKMHAGAFATAWFLLAAILHFGSLRAVILGGLFLVFYYVTAPLGAMFLGRLLDRAEAFDDEREPR